MKAKIVLLPGDGIGPEVDARPRARCSKRSRAAIGTRSSSRSHLIGGIAIDETGKPLPARRSRPAELPTRCCSARSAGRSGTTRTPRSGPKQGLLALRQGLGVYANLRPVKRYPELVDASPLKPERVAGVDMLLVRELTGGLYFGQPRCRETTPTGERAVDTLEYTDDEIRRVVRLAFTLARGRRTPRDLGRQGERARVVAAVAPGRERGRERLHRHQARAPAGRLVRDAAGHAAPRSST